MLEGIKHLFSKLKKDNGDVNITEIDPKSIQDNHTIKFQQNQIADLQGERDRLKSEQGLDRESDRDIEEENEIKGELNEQQKQINKENFGTYFSLGNFFIKIMKDKTFRDNLYFTTYDRSKRLGKFGDIGFSEKGFAVFDSKGEIVQSGMTLNEVFWFVNALGNDIQAGTIPLTYNNKFQSIENIMKYEPAETYRVNGEIQFKTARKKAVYDILAEKDERISELITELSEKEDALDKMQNEIDKLKMVADVSQTSGEIARNEKSKMAGSVSKMEELFSHLTSELSKQYRIHEVDEDTISKFETQLGKLKAEAERSGSTPSFDDAIGKIENMFSIIKKNRMIPKESETKPAK